MQDEPLSQPLPLPKPRRSVTAMLAIALLAFVLGGAAVAWLASSGRLAALLPGGTETAASRLHTPSAQVPAARPDGPPTPASAIESATLGSVETRLALIEDRLARISGDANAASGNAARAEALLIAYAARRRIDKGEPLGFVENQLRLRFGGAQPQAVRLIVAAGKAPITLDDLSGQLEAAAPSLKGVVHDESTWTRARREIASLFVVRRVPQPTTTPASRISRARLMLARGQIEDAIVEVEHLPGAEAARDWIASARRYEATQRALDLIETSAMLEPRNLRDANGKAVEQASPLTPPAEAAAGE